jgi:hypothetical protein
MGECRLARHVGATGYEGFCTLHSERVPWSQCDVEHVATAAIDRTRRREPTADMGGNGRGADRSDQAEMTPRGTTDIELASEYTVQSLAGLTGSARLT